MPVNIDRLSTGGAFAGPLVRSVLPEPAAARELQAGETLGPFRIIAEISRGGMAIVYLAERCDGQFTQRVALKWMSCSEDHEIAEAMFRRERDIVASLEHPGIARLIDGGRDHGALWFAMELVDGQPIDRWCDAKACSLEERLSLFIGLCNALAFAHARLLIHRDIKPANVLVSNSGQLKLLDFGIARLADQRDLLGNGALTPGFASPEQWRGEEVTIASDIFQAGLVLAIITGALRDDGGEGHVTQALTAPTLRSPQPQWLSQQLLSPLPHDLRAIIACATALAPEQRYASALGMADDVQRFIDGRPVAARRGGMWYRGGRLLRRFPWVSAASMLALAALLALGWQLAIERDLARAQAASANEQAQSATAALGFVTDLLKWAKPTVSGGAAVSVDDALQRGVEQLRSDIGIPSSVRARLLWTLGQVYIQRRDRDRARPLLEEARALLRSDATADRRMMGMVAVNLASTMSAMDERQRSMALLDEAFVLLEGDAELASYRLDTRRIKAIRLYQDGDLYGSIAVVDAALAEAARTLPADDSTIEALQLAQAESLSALDRSDEAIAITRSLLALSESRRGPDDALSLRARGRLISALISAGAFDAALPLIDQDRAILLRLYGDRHPEYAQWLRRRARFELGLGHLDQARRDVLAAIDIAQSSGAQGSTLVANCYATLGRLELAAKRPREAEAAFRVAVAPEFSGASLANDFGGARLDLVRALIDLGGIVAARREFAVAREESAPLAKVPSRRAQLLYLDARFAQRDGDRAAAHRSAAAAMAALRRAPHPDPRFVAELQQLLRATAPEM